ncbi:DUF1678 family protein [Methanopyrus kandleri]
MISLDRDKALELARHLIRHLRSVLETLLTDISNLRTRGTKDIRPQAEPNPRRTKSAKYPQPAERTFPIGWDHS